MNENKKFTERVVNKAIQLKENKGGSFEQSLFKTMSVADATNLKTLKDAFPFYGEVHEAFKSGA